MKTDAELNDICSSLLAKKVHSRALSLRLDELKRFYSLLAKALGGRVPAASIVNLGNEVFVQFSDISPQHFLVVGKKTFSKEDFDFVLQKKWYGPTDKLPGFVGFFIGELRLNKWALIFVFVLSAILLYLAQENELYKKVSELVVQSATVFLSIYLIFTATQNQFLQSDDRLFEQGLLQRFYADDRNLTILAIATILLSVLNVMLAYALQTHDPKQILWIDRHIILSLSTALVVCLLIDTPLCHNE